MKWKDNLLNDFIFQLHHSKENYSTVLEQIENKDTISIHLAVFNDLFLKPILDKDKKIESRFSINRTSPFRKVHSGDIVLIKRVAGNVLGFFICGKIDYWILNKNINLLELEIKYSEAIYSKIDTNFWKTKTNSKFATFIEIKELFLIDEISISKQDRTSWTILRDRNRQLLFEF